MQEYVNIDAKGNILDVLKKMNEGFEKSSKSSKAFEESASGSLNKIQQRLKSVSFASFQQNLASLNQGLQDLNAPGLKFDSSLRELSALTGVTGEKLEQLGDKARASAKEFGGSASDSLNSYKTILGRLGPDIAKDQNALSDMERNVQILSKTMGGDAAGAVDALTTGMLQYGVDLSNPKTATQEMTRMMNVMAAGAQAGAAEVPQISAALKVAGTQAKLSKVTFEETNAAIQALAQGGKEGSDAGVALRNILGKIAGEDIIPKEAVGKLKALGVDMSIVSNTSIPFTDRLRELKKAQADATLVAQIFGTENAAAANILLNSVDAQDKLRKQITGTKSAEEQAAIVMQSREEQLKRFNASIEDAKIAFFNATGGATAFLEPISQLATTFASFAPLVSGAAGMVSKLAKSELVSNVATKAVTAAQWLWNAALTANPIGLVVVAIAALAAGAYAVAKAFDTSTASQRINEEVSNRVIEKTADQRAELEMLFETLKHSKKGSKEFNETLEDLEKMQPGIVEKYNLQAGAIKDINAAQREMIANIDAIARAEAYKEITKEKYKAALKEQMEGPGFGDYLSSIGSLGLVSAEDYNKIDAANMLKDAKTSAKLQAKFLSSSAYLNATGKSANNTTPTGISKDLKQLQPSGSGLTNPKGYTPSSTNTSSSSVATGEVKRIDVRIENLVRAININTTNIKESMADIKKQVSEAIIGGVRDFEVAI